MLLVFSFMLGWIPIAIAHEKKEQHWADFERIIFGRELLPSERVGAVRKLEYASALVLDQFNETGSDMHQFLVNEHVYGVPATIDAYNLHTSPNVHQSFTHRGWEHIYEIDSANWPVRKEMLLATVENVFDFSPTKGTLIGSVFQEPYSNKCNSFAAVMYYVHVLGDHAEAKNYKAVSGKLIIPVVRLHPGETNRDILWELEHHLPIIFADQHNTRTYKNMMSELEALGKKMRSLLGSTGSIDSDEKYTAYMECLKELFTILEDHMPKLLKQESFFTNVFSNY